MEKILITGATGFIGRGLVKHLLGYDFELNAAVRQQSSSLPLSIKQIQVGNLSSDTNWMKALSGIDIVIHLAARVHSMDDDVGSLTEFQKINTEGTLNLAQQAVKAGVDRFIFISSIKVNGETTEIGLPFTEDDTNIPTDPYGLSKYETEQRLTELSSKLNIEVVIIRPPIVYGSGVKGNFLKMMSWLDKGVPLPLGSIHSQRSLVALDNLVDLITVCIDHPAAANQVLLVSDGNDLSTTVLLQSIGKALGKPARLLPVPKVFLTASLNILGKKAIADRLCSSLQVDISKAQKLLDWTPQVTTVEAVQDMADTYLRGKSFKD